jgi:hypothetical protein
MLFSALLEVPIRIEVKLVRTFGGEATEGNGDENRAHEPDGVYSNTIGWWIYALIFETSEG